jgi:serine/threonine protein kinase
LVSIYLFYSILNKKEKEKNKIEIEKNKILEEKNKIFEELKEIYGYCVLRYTYIDFNHIKNIEYQKIETNFSKIYKGDLIIYKENNNIEAKTNENNNNIETKTKKIILKLVKKGFGKQFFNELNISKFHHENILNVLGYSSDLKKKENYVISEYIEKGSLNKSSNLKEYNDLTFKDKLYFIKGIAIGIKHLHDNNVIHLDLKPENILINNNFIPLICDFGISFFVKKDDNNYPLLNEKEKGTLNYLAPEQLSSKNKEISYKTDIYSFGGIIYFILYSENPRESTPNNELRSDISNGLLPTPTKTIDKPNDYQKFLIEIINKTLIIDINKRSDIGNIIIDIEKKLK